MAFGKRREPESYGVPMRSSAPAQPAPPAPNQAQNTAPSQSWAAPAAPAPGGYLATPAPAPMPAGAQYAAGVSPYPPQAPAMNGYAPLQTPPPYARQGWAPPPPAYGTGYGPPPGYVPPKSGVRNPFLIAGAAVLALIVIAGIVGFVQDRQQRAALTAPETLGGYSKLDDPAVQAQLDIVSKQATALIPGMAHTEVAYGGADGTPTVMLVALRTHDSGEASAFVRGARQGIDDPRFDPGPWQAFGDARCAASQTLPLAVCTWEARVSGIVVLVGPTDLRAAADVAEEARAALN